MSRKLALFLALMLSGLSVGSLPESANAQTPLTRAVIQALRNRVRLMQKNRPVRSAQVSDAMTPGDALATARASLAELRFNDGSLARVGEQAVFRFVPNARTFQLSNGTMLLLIPPGRGPTGIRTPNAAAGIKGSALFVRYIPDTDTTLVGALTNNPQGPMVIYNRDGSQSQGLRAGQLAVVVKNRIENVYDFDLNTFYQTSDLVKGLNLTQKESNSPSDEAIAAVRAETVEALQTQSPFQAANVIENPTFVRLPSDSTDFPTNNLDRVFNSLDVRRVVEAGEVQSEQTLAYPTEAGSSTAPPSARTVPPTPLTPGAPPSSSGASQGNPSGNPVINPPQPAQANPTPRPTEAVGQRPEKVAPESRLLAPRPIESVTSTPPPSDPTLPVVTTPPLINGSPGPAQNPSPGPDLEVGGEVSGGVTPPDAPPVVTGPPILPTPTPTDNPGLGTNSPGQTQGPSDGGSPTPPSIPETPPKPPVEIPPVGSPAPTDPQPPILVEPGSGTPVVPIDPTLPSNFPGQGNTGGVFPGGANGGNFPGQGPATPAPTPDPASGGQPTPTSPVNTTPTDGGTTGSPFPGGGATGGIFPGKANDGNFPGRGLINK